MELNDYDKSRCRFHLGYNVGANLPAGDIARLEEAMARVPDSYFYSRVLEHLDRCDKVFKVSQIFKSEAQPQPSRVERITGDTERAIFQSEPLKADKDYWEVYLRDRPPGSNPLRRQLPARRGSALRLRQGGL